jgi:hypothetical protein
VELLRKKMRKYDLVICLMEMETFQGFRFCRDAHKPCSLFSIFSNLYRYLNEDVVYKRDETSFMYHIAYRKSMISFIGCM